MLDSGIDRVGSYRCVVFGNFHRFWLPMVASGDFLYYY
jgi:hypothetical protein